MMLCPSEVPQEPQRSYHGWLAQAGSLQHGEHARTRVGQKSEATTAPASRACACACAFVLIHRHAGTPLLLSSAVAIWHVAATGSGLTSLVGSPLQNAAP